MKDNKSLLILMLTLVANSIHSQIPTEGLFAYYPFSNNTLDESGTGNDAIAYGCSYMDDRHGNANSALYVNGESDQLEIPNNEFTPLSSDFSISLWMKTPLQMRSHLLSIGNWLGGDGDGGNFQITIHSGNTVWAYWNGLGDDALYSIWPIYVNDDKWHHMVFTRTAGFIQLWIDRELIPMMTYSSTDYTEDIGDDEPILVGGTDYAYRGVVDDIALYNVGLNEQEVHQLYHDQRPIVVLSPRFTDAYPQNTASNFEWKTAANISTLKLEYSLNDGDTWNLITQGLSAAATNFEWPMNFVIATQIWVRISDAMNTETDVVVGPFIISEYHWQEVNTNCAWQARDGAGVLVYDEKMWLLGGWNPYLEEWLPGYTCSEVWNSTDGENWTFVTDAPWGGRHTAGWLVHDDKMWIVGGDWNSGEQQMDVWNSTDGLNWNLVLDTLPMEVRMTHMVASLNDEIIYFGGQTLTFLDFVGAEWYSDVWSSSDGENWTELTDSAGWHPRGQVQGNFVRNDTLWLVGGGTYDGRYMYSDVWYTDNGSDWAMATEAADFPPRQYADECVFDNRLWLMGGGDMLSNLSDVWYSDNGANWFELRNTPWPARHASAVCVYDSSMWIISGNLWNDSWRLMKEDIPEYVFNETTPTTDFEIFPNPARDAVELNWNTEADELVLTDELGKEVARHIVRGIRFIQINVSNLSSGVYQATLNTADRKVVRKFVVE